MLIVMPIAVLLLIPGIVLATNERSYKFGFNLGVDDYKHCFDNDAPDCSPPNNDESLTICVNSPVNQDVTNSTACLDGYIQGWQHWCKSDIKDCAEFTMEGLLPGALIAPNNVFHSMGSYYINLSQYNYLDAP
jgi:hypothetical protein